LNWFWVALAATAPLALGFLIAWPFWRKGMTTFGSSVGAGMIFMAGAALIGREFTELERLTEQCLAETGFECVFRPSAFARFAVYAGIALVQVFILFDASIAADRRHYRRHFPSEWK
jgi:hypothetical protein